MRRALFFLALFVPFLPGCPVSFVGDELCAAADVVTVCGIDVAVCNDRLADFNSDFYADHVFINVSVEVADDGACLMHVIDSNSDNAVVRGWNDTEPRDFYLGDALVDVEGEDEDEEDEEDEVVVE